MADKILPEFQDFLLYRSLVPAKNVPFYAHRVSKFLAFSNRNQDLGPNLKVQEFLNQLKAQKNRCAAGLDSGDVKDFLNYLALIR